MRGLESGRSFSTSQGEEIGGKHRADRYTVREMIAYAAAERGVSESFAADTLWEMVRLGRFDSRGNLLR
jgi:nucleoid-associated protein YejK